MKRLNSAVLFLTFASLLGGCTKSRNNGAPANPPTDNVSYKFQTQIKADALSDDRTGLASAINSGKTINFSDLTKLFILDQASEHRKTTGMSYSDKVGLEWVAGVKQSSQNVPVLKMKAAYEDLIEKSNNNPEIVYNSEATTLFHELSENKMQCFSGTSLNLAVLRESFMGSEYRKQNLVVIIKPGHILPGQMIATGRGYRLVGIETTGTGDSIIDMGLAKNLTGAIRIVDAETYVIAKVFEKALTGTDFLKEALTSAALKYSINLESLERDVARELAKQSSSSGAAPFNSSIFAFSSPEIIKGDVKRQDVGESADDLTSEIASEELADKQSPGGQELPSPAERGGFIVKGPLENYFGGFAVIEDFDENGGHRRNIIDSTSPNETITSALTGALRQAIIEDRIVEITGNGYGCAFGPYDAGLMRSLSTDRHSTVSWILNALDETKHGEYFTWICEMDSDLSQVPEFEEFLQMKNNKDLFSSYYRNKSCSNHSCSSFY